MRLELQARSKTEVDIVCVDDNEEKHLVGKVTTPSGSGKDHQNCVQVCGFSEAFDMWGCGLFAIPSEFFKGLYVQQKDIQLMFSPKTVEHTVENASSKCLRCYNNPCTCEVSKHTERVFGEYDGEDSNNPYTVKRAHRLLLEQVKPTGTCKECGEKFSCFIDQKRYPCEHKTCGECLCYKCYKKMHDAEKEAVK